MGLADIRLTQEVAWEALLVEAGEATQDGEVAKVTGGREENREERWQKRFTQVLQQFIVDEHKTKMKIGGREEDLEIAPSDQEIPSGWPPLQATQHRSPRYSVQSGLAVKIGIDDIRTMKKSCPFCGKALTSQHSLVCVKANQNMIISRHNTTTKTIGTHIASTGIMVNMRRSYLLTQQKPHIPDMTCIKDTVQHHIDVAICQRYRETGT